MRYWSHRECYHWDGTDVNHLNFSWVINGKLAGHAAPSSVEDLTWLKNKGILALVRMAEENKQGISKHQIEQLGLLDCYEPVPDFTAPNPAQISSMVEFISRAISSGRPVAVSCSAGLGRTGTILACYLTTQGCSAQQAIKTVRAKRPGSIETKGQEEAVINYKAG